MALWHIRELIWGGKLPYIHAGKRFIVDRADLDKLIESEKRLV
jgi:hypothetical protein